jgi:hypothetical protein
MNDRPLKEMLKESIAMELQLYDFCIAALKRIYGDESDFALGEFEDSYNYNKEFGCLQALECIDANLANDKKEREKTKALKP